MEPGTPAIVFRDRTFPRIDTQRVLRLYAAVTLAIGTTVVATGIRGLPGVPLAYASLIWIAGAAMAAAGCAAMGLSLIDDPVRRRIAVNMFAAGHVFLGLLVWMQWAVYWESQGLPLPVALMPLVTGILLFAVAAASRPQENGGAAASPRRLRSTYEAQIRRLARREECTRLARDLHDAVKQQLFVIQTAAATAQTRFAQSPEAAQAALAQVRTAAREATTEMEALLGELQAVPHEMTGLIEALKKQCEALAFRTGAVVTFDPPTLKDIALEPGAYEAIYRVAQEALSNVARHARATRVTVSLSANLTRVELRIADNGSGFDPRTVKDGMGTSTMHARALEAGGYISTTTGTSGTEVTLRVPLVNRELSRALVGAALFGLVILSFAVFYGLRGHPPEQPGPLILAVWGLLALRRVVAAYRRRPR